MKHRSLLLFAVVIVALVAAAGVTMGFTAHQSKTVATPEATITGAPADGGFSSALEPVVCPSCAGGCPVPLGACEFGGQVCQCPRGPGHCVACQGSSGGQCEDFKCVKDL